MNYELLSYLLKASLVLAILTTAYAWLVKRETFLQVNRWLLWINVAATLLLPIIPLPDLEWVPNAPAQAVAVVLPPKPASPVPKVTKSEPFIAPTPQATTVSSAVLEDSSLSVWDWIGIVYGVVAGLLVLKLLIQLGALWRLQHGSTQYETEDGVYLIENDKITSPFSFFNRIFYNPTHHNDDEWAQVWAHECVHAHQLHSIDMLTAEVLKIVFWFNPFAWWHQRLVQETLEFITDRAVLDSGIEKKSYQYHLLRTTLSADKQTFTNHFGVPHFNKSLLKTRIEMMNKSKSKWLGVGKYFLFVAMLWVCAAFSKPYRAEIAAKIVKEVPELNMVMGPRPAQKVVFNDFVMDETEKSITDLSSFKNIIMESETKYVFYKDSILHWVITPMTSFSDFVLIQEEFNKRGLKIIATEWRTDPWGRFNRAVSISCYRSDQELGKFEVNSNNGKIRPISSFGGQIPLNPHNQSHTFDSNVSALFKAYAEADEKTASVFKDLFRIDYLEKELEERLRRCTDAGSESSSFEYLITDGQQLKVSKGQWVLENSYRKTVIDNPYENAKLFLDGNEVSFDDVVFEKVKRVKFYFICTAEGGNAVLLFTKK